MYTTQLFQKKPVRVPAIELKHDRDCQLAIIEWARQSNVEIHLGADGGLVIPTLEGDMQAVTGDYIIRGIKGEFYPCKPDIFEATYEKVESYYSEYDKLRDAAHNR